MKDVNYLLLQLLSTLGKIIQPGGSRAVTAENLLLEQQLIIHSRSRQRAPNLATGDRALLGFWSLFMNPGRIARAAVIIKPSTLLSFHNALKTHWIMVAMDQYSHRINGFGVRQGHVDGHAICRMFNAATSRQGWPVRRSTDNDPLFQYSRWKANLRVLEIEAIKSLPHVPMSHPFVKQPIGSVRRELLDPTFFWTATDLENELRDYQRYYNEQRCHSSRDGDTPA